jgi:3-oxoacyl-[acyl-carrier protein] reductase
MKNKKVFITGATGGIGEAICNKFYQKEYNLVLTSSSDEKLLSLKKKYGDNNSYYKIDISDFESIDRCMSQITSDHKDLAIIINNAGITSDNLLLRMRNDQWSKVIKTNLESNFFIVKSLLPNMISNRYGKIIGISSVVAVQGNPGQSNYVASKAGMIGFYKSIAHEVAKRNINVNVVSPGFISTNMTDKLEESQKNNILDKIPMKKFGIPDDVANLVYFLSSDKSSYITGQNFNVNGGMLMF